MNKALGRSAQMAIAVVNDHGFRRSGVDRLGTSFAVQNPGGHTLAVQANPAPFTTQAEIGRGSVSATQGWFSPAEKSSDPVPFTSLKMMLPTLLKAYGPE